MESVMQLVGGQLMPSKDSICHLPTYFHHPSIMQLIIQPSGWGEKYRPVCVPHTWGNWVLTHMLLLFSAEKIRSQDIIFWS